MKAGAIADNGLADCLRLLLHEYCTTLKKKKGVFTGRRREIGFDTVRALAEVGNERIAHPSADCLSFSSTSRCSFALAFEARPAIALSKAGDSNRANVLFFNEGQPQQDFVRF